MPKEMTEITFTKYQKRGSYHWHQISRSLFKYNAYVSARYQQVVQAIPEKQYQKILDIGCGDGVLAWLIYQKTKGNIIGVDTDIIGLKTAKKKHQLLKTNVQFKKASAYKLPFKSDSIDVVIAAEIIEHLSHPRRMLKEVARVLKPTGKVIITTPVKLTSMPKDTMHVREFTSKDLTGLLTQYFCQITIHSSHPVWLKRLYTLTLLRFGRYHLDLFRWVINLIVLVTKYNPFINLPGKSSQQLAIGKPKQ